LILIYFIASLNSVIGWARPIYPVIYFVELFKDRFKSQYKFKRLLLQRIKTTTAYGKTETFNSI